jgi:hypothetical protein
MKMQDNRQRQNVLDERIAFWACLLVLLISVATIAGLAIYLVTELPATHVLVTGAAIMVIIGSFFALPVFRIINALLVPFSADAARRKISHESSGASQFEMSSSDVLFRECMCSGEYNLAAIRNLVKDAFTGCEDLQRFCQDRPTFREVLDLFGQNCGMEDGVDVLIRYCEAKVKLAELLLEIRAFNPRQYERHCKDLYVENG